MLNIKRTAVITPELERKLSKLEKMVMEYGLDNSAVLRFSQHLDKLIVKTMIKEKSDHD